MRNYALLSMWLFTACGDDGGSMFDAADTIDADTTDAPQPDAPRTDRAGIVIVNEVTDDMGNLEANAAATLYDGPLFGGPVASAGGCDQLLDLSDGPVSAGTIAITGTLEPVDLVYDTSAMEYDTAAPPPADLFDADATITFAAAGDTIPAFGGTVTAPAALENVTLPTTISRAAPPIITWTAGTGDESWTWILAIDTNGGAFQLLFCRHTDNGSFEIPAAALALIPNNFNAASVIAWRTNATPVTAGDWTIHLTAATAFTVEDPVPLTP
jgi:hypothetical protein